jgi:hypothetical protein
MANERPTEMNLKIAQAYILQMRNEAKKAYAWAYLRFALTDGDIGPDRGKLSYMAAQAVRLRITEILRGM